MEFGFHPANKRARVEERLRRLEPGARFAQYDVALLTLFQLLHQLLHERTGYVRGYMFLRMHEHAAIENGFGRVQRG